MKSETNIVKQDTHKAFGQSNKSQVIKDYSSTIDKFDAIVHQNKTIATQLTSDINIRYPFNRADYDYYRPQDRLPKRFRDVVNTCRSVYLRVGVVRNVINMMTDFATEGLKIIHPDKKTEAFFKVWMKKAKLNESVDEFVRHFLIDGNVVVKRTKAKITKPVETQWTQRTMADDKAEKLYTEDKTNKREIPWKYTFINITALQWIGGESAQANGGKKLAFVFSRDLLKSLKTPTDPFQVGLAGSLSPEVKDIVNKGSQTIDLDMDSVYIAHNKKDSWEDWAPPFLYSILSEITLRDKLRQAEICALDGMINVIRLWKIGDHSEGILPNQAAVDKLIRILEANTGGGSMDIVWDSMIEMEEFYPPIDKILGSDKYDQVNRDILIGLGIPEVLIGGQGGNFSNSYIQLKTLVEKLEYVRESVICWLQEEINMVCDAMDITVYPRIRFSQWSLEDEGVARKLVVGLLDRGVISVEAVLEAYGEDFLIEVERMKNEKKSLKTAGIEPKSPLDQDPNAKTGNVGPGRPAGQNDAGRDKRTPNIRKSAGSVDLTVFALDAIDAIDEHIIPLYMDNMGVSNARKLTNEQKEELNNARAVVLACIKPIDDIYTLGGILSVCQDLKNPNMKVIAEISNAISEYTSSTGNVPTLNQRKRIEAIEWSKINSLL